MRKKARIRKANQQDETPRGRCTVCNSELIESSYPHECLHYPPYMMEEVYGPLWRTKHPDYDTRYRDMRRRIREQEAEESETEEVQDGDTARLSLPVGLGVSELETEAE